MKTLQGKDPSAEGSSKLALSHTTSSIKGGGDLPFRAPVESAWWWRWRLRLFPFLPPPKFCGPGWPDLTDSELQAGVERLDFLIGGPAFRSRFARALESDILHQLQQRDNPVGRTSYKVELEASPDYLLSLISPTLGTADNKSLTARPKEM